MHKDCRVEAGREKEEKRKKNAARKIGMVIGGKTMGLISLA